LRFYYKEGRRVVIILAFLNTDPLPTLFRMFVVGLVVVVRVGVRQFFVDMLVCVGRRGFG
jgi:hypothetical protein